MHKEITREDQGKIIAHRLEQSKKLYNYWRRISQRFIAGEKVNLRVDDRPDEVNMK